MDCISLMPALAKKFTVLPGNLDYLTRHSCNETFSFDTVAASAGIDDDIVSNCRQEQALFPG